MFLGWRGIIVGLRVEAARGQLGFWGHWLGCGAAAVRVEGFGSRVVGGVSRDVRMRRQDVTLWRRWRWSVRTGEYGHLGAKGT